MNVSEEERTFLRDLVKISRQKPHHVSWVDRDGTDRVTTFSQSEIVRLSALAQQLRIGKSELMRQASHIPAAKPAPGAPSSLPAPS